MLDYGPLTKSIINGKIVWAFSYFKERRQMRELKHNLNSVER